MEYKKILFYDPYPPDIKRVLSLIDEKDKVLDVGGCWKPLNRANAVIDLMPYQHRGGGGSIGPGPENFSRDTWIEMDVCGEKWPFEDKSFDFVYCGQLLEDVRDPIWVCKEIQRVGKRGYIETPTIWIECQYDIDQELDPTLYPGYHKHRWLVRIDDGLFFIPKLIYLASLHFIDSEKSRFYRQFHRIWTQPFFWEGNFKFDVMRYPWTQDLINRLETYFAEFDYSIFTNADNDGLSYETP